MSIKLRILCYPKKGKLDNFAQAIAEKYQLTANSIDVIPPGYPCNNERIVIIGASFRGDVPDKLRIFARELSKSRAQNVALYINGNESSANKLVSILKEAGTNIVEEVQYVNGGLLPIFSKINGNEKSSMLEWVERILTKLT